MATAKQWEKYLRECGYAPGDQVMYSKPNDDISYRVDAWSFGPIQERAKQWERDRFNVFRIFTPDGKTQKGVDWKPEPSKRERIVQALNRWAISTPGISCFPTYWHPIIEEILKICEVEE